MAGWILELELVYFNNTMAWRCIDNVMLVIDRFWAGSEGRVIGPGANPLQGRYRYNVMVNDDVMILYIELAHHWPLHMTMVV